MLRQVKKRDAHNASLFCSLFFDFFIYPANRTGSAGRNFVKLHNFPFGNTIQVG
jgi:hypothetical protein